MQAAAVILAAGASRRLGEPKQLVRLGGELLLERAARLAAEAGCAPVVVVLGCAAKKIQDACDLRGPTVLTHDGWDEGMGSSLGAGVAALAPECRAVVVMTCDQPAVTADHLRLLVARCGEKPVASMYAGRRGVPAVFPAACFEDLRRLRGDAGARSLLEAADAVELAGGEVDIDSPQALAVARAMYG